MSDDTQTFGSEKRQVSLRNLYLDPNNYRLIHHETYHKVSEDEVVNKNVQHRTFQMITGDRNQHVQDLLNSFMANGYLPVDQIQVRPISPGKFLVVEGNRRVAALKILQTKHEERRSDLGNLNPQIFSKVPVILYTDSNEMHHLTLMALKHISGNKKWGEWNQAKLLERMHKEYKFSDDEICHRIGISKYELRRSLRALSFLEQYIESDYGDQFSEAKFPIFREAARNQDLKEWFNWDDDKYKGRNQENMGLFFSWISREPIEIEDSEGSVEYTSEYHEPALTKRDEIRLLGAIVKDQKALEKMKLSRDINMAYQSSDRIFRERQQAAIQSISNETDNLSQMAIQAEYFPKLERSLGRLQGIVNKAKASEIGGVESTSVFRDRVDAHFSSIKFDQYRNLTDLQLNELSRINLLTGINNSGKTSVLEGLYLLCRQNDFAGLLEIIRRRGKLAEGYINSTWLLEQMPNDMKSSRNIQLSGIFDSQKSTVSIQRYEDENIDKYQYLSSVEIKSSFGAVKKESFTHIYSGRDREVVASDIRILCQSIFSSPFFLNEPHRYAGFYHKSIQSKALPKIFEFIREEVLPSLDDIRLADEWQRFLVSDKEYEQVLDLTQYGEGIQRIFFISLLFASAQHGVLLIDEFENAIHTEVIGKFTQFISSLSKLFNTQVFLTSHSKECIDAFVKGIPNTDDLTATALVNEKGLTQFRQFSGSEYKKLLETGNVDLRRAH